MLLDLHELFVCAATHHYWPLLSLGLSFSLASLVSLLHEQYIAPMLASSQVTNSAKPLNELSFNCVKCSSTDNYGMAHFGNFLRDWASHRGFSVPELARVSGVSLRTMWRVLKSPENTLQPRNVAALAKALGANQEEFDEAWKQAKLGVFEGFGVLPHIGAVGQAIPVVNLDDVRVRLSDWQPDSGAVERFALCSQVKDPAAVAFVMPDDSMRGVVEKGELVFLEYARIWLQRAQWPSEFRGVLGLVEAATTNGITRCFGFIVPGPDRIFVARSNPTYEPGNFVSDRHSLDVWIATVSQRMLRRDRSIEGPLTLQVDAEKHRHGK